MTRVIDPARGWRLVRCEPGQLGGRPTAHNEGARAWHTVELIGMLFLAMRARRRTC
jgi:hypothetical protein